MNSTNRRANPLNETLTPAPKMVREGGTAARERTAQLVSDLAVARTAPDAGSNLFSTAYSKFAVLFYEQPLLMGVVGVAIRVGIAASLPATKVESEYLGDASDALKRKGTQVASDQREGLQTVAGGSTPVADEARTQGLTVDGLSALSGSGESKAHSSLEAAPDGRRSI